MIIEIVILIIYFIVVKIINYIEVHLLFVYFINNIAIDLIISLICLFYLF